MVHIYIKKLSDTAIVPTKHTSLDAGYDLYSTEEYILQPGERRVFFTNISMALPQGYYARIAPKSGLATTYGLDVLAGVIDAGYRGNYGVVLYNTSRESINISVGMKIAQMILERYHEAEFEEVDELDDTERGVGGWGSSGV